MKDIYWSHSKLTLINCLHLPFLCLWWLSEPPAVGWAAPTYSCPFFLLLIVVLEEMQKGHHNHRNEVSLLLRRNACVPRWLSVRELKMLFSWFSTSNGSCGTCENWHISSIMPAIKTLFELQTSFEETCQVLSSYVSCWTSTSARMQEKDQKYFLCLQTWTDQT